MIRTGSITAACVAGAASGAAVTACAFALAFVVPQAAGDGVSAQDLPYALGNLALFTTLVFIGALIVFSTGLLLIGLPAWFLLHRAGRRSRADAVIAGSLLSGGAPLALALATGSPGDPATLITCLSVSLAGAVAGWTLHRIAYGGSKPA